MRNSRVLGRQLLRMGSCKSTQTLSPTSIAAELPSPPPNLDFLQHKIRIKGFSSSASEYPDWKWNKFWSMHVPWEDRRLFVVPQKFACIKRMSMIWSLKEFKINLYQQSSASINMTFKRTGEEKIRTQGLDTQVKKDRNGEEVYSVFEVEAAAGDNSDTSYELKYYSKCPCDLCLGMRRLRQWLSQQSETQIAKDEK